MNTVVSQSDIRQKEMVFDMYVDISITKLRMNVVLTGKDCLILDSDLSRVLQPLIENYPGNRWTISNATDEDASWILSEFVGTDLTVADNPRSLIGHRHFDVCFSFPTTVLSSHDIQLALQLADHVAVHTPFDWLLSGDRPSHFKFNQPDMYAISNRPRFNHLGRQNYRYFAWLVWHLRRNRRHGEIMLLD